MSLLAKAEPSVSMVTRSSLFYMGILQSLCVASSPRTHTHTHRFLSAFHVHVAFFTSSPTPHQLPLLFLILKNSFNTAASSVFLFYSMFLVALRFFMYIIQ